MLLFLRIIGQRFAIDGIYSSQCSIFNDDFALSSYFRLVLSFRPLIFFLREFYLLFWTLIYAFLSSFWSSVGVFFDFWFFSDIQFLFDSSSFILRGSHFFLSPFLNFDVYLILAFSFFYIFLSSIIFNSAPFRLRDPHYF